jgi:SAM-dependent methyltransferase
VAEKRETMLAFWSERAKRFGADPRSNTNDIWLREIEIACVHHIIRSHGVVRILDFGCANGFTTVRLAGANPHCRFVGVDLNPDMVRVAQQGAETAGFENVAFRQADILAQDLGQRFDFIYAIRVFQNIETPEKQRLLFDKLHEFLEPGGLFYYIESYEDGYGQLNRDRAGMGLPLLPIHPHLTLLTDEFDRHVASRMDLLERASPSSSYYLITRLLYSYIAMKNGEAIDYNHPIHQVAAMVPQIGEYGPQRAALYRKKPSKLSA